MLFLIYHLQLTRCALVSPVACLPYQLHNYFMGIFISTSSPYTLSVIALLSWILQTLHPVPSKISERTQHSTGTTLLSQQNQESATANSLTWNPDQ